MESEYLHRQKSTETEDSRKVNLLFGRFFVLGTQFLTEWVNVNRVEEEGIPLDTFTFGL